MASHVNLKCMHGFLKKLTSTIFKYEIYVNEREDQPISTFITKQLPISHDIESRYLPS